MEASARRQEYDGLTPRLIYERLDRYVIGQVEAKRAVAIAAYNHLKRVEARRRRQATILRKSNILLVGPTGSGKTHLARTLAGVMSVPFTSVDATEYTEAGYYGKDVEAMIAELLLTADHAVEDAERGIIFLDEVDKIGRRTQGAKNGAGARDIGGEGVQQALLKLLEGREVYVPLSPTQQLGKHDFVRVDTRDILFICAGAFSDLIGDEENKAPVGFGQSTAAKASPRRRVTVKGLEGFGLLPEFLGRLPVIVQLDRLSDDELLRVLTEPPDAMTREYAELLALDGIDLKFTRGALLEVVRHAREKGLGARGLRAVLEHAMAELMFEAPEQQKHPIKIDADFVRRRLATADVTV